MIITWKPFDNLILTLILLNSLMIALTDYTVRLLCVSVSHNQYLPTIFFYQISATGALHVWAFVRMRA